MSVWDAYYDRMDVRGYTRRERALFQTRTRLTDELHASLSYHKVLINGKEHDAAIIGQEELAIKKICLLPGDILPHGGLVDYADNKWLITEVDASNEVYHSGMMQQCNHIIRWIDRNGDLVEKWSIIEDGTKYLIGEKTSQIMTIGDARIAMTVGKDEDTIYLCRGMRFLVDDVDAEDVLAYQITKVNKLFNNYNNEGVFRFILTEVNVTADDNLLMRIADFYNWKPEPDPIEPDRDETATVEEIVQEALDQEPPSDDKEVWI